MTCTVCGREIGNGETYKVVENGDIVCIDTECRMAYMLEHLTESDKAEYFALCDVAEVETYAQENGLDSLPPWELHLMLEWYESGDCYEREYEPDEVNDFWADANIGWAS